MTQLCPNCGFNNPPGMRFCGNCGTRLPEAAPIPEETKPVDDTPQKLGAMVGADLLERFRKAGLEAAGQRRTVTVLFVDLSGYTRLSQRLDPEDLYELIQQYIQLLANDVYKYEGMVDKFTGDGLMALFGAPVANENNAELAVRAAIDMRTDVANLSQQMHDTLGSELQIHVGLNSGSVIVGGIGSNMMMNYTAIGDTVNMAQRLEESAAPGTILVSDSVYRQTKALFEYNQSPTLQLKGVARPVKGYQVVGAKAKPGRVRGIEGLRAPMIGRDNELFALEKAVRNLEDGKGSFVLITGEAGIGKSRLTAELKERLYLKPLTVVEGQSLTYRRTVPYWIFLDALRNYLGVTLDTPEAAMQGRLRRTVQDVLDERASEALIFLEQLFSLPLTDSSAAERIGYLDAGQLRTQIFLAIRDLLVAEAHRHPLVLILEDLHWADEASLDLLSFLLDSVTQAPLMILAISRTLQEGTMVKIVDRASHHLDDRYCAISLQSLSVPQSEELLFKLLQIPELGGTLRDQILQRAAGIPFYLEEILRMLIDRDILRRENERWVVATETSLRSLDVPDTLEGLILTRFDRLEEMQRRVLQVASAIGRQFNCLVLEEVLKAIPKERVEESLLQLVRREFVVNQSSGAFSEYAFRHSLMSDAIYKTLLRKELRELHGQIGVAIESVYANRIEAQIEILARHFSWSTYTDKALHYLILAGQKASRNYANDQARQHYEQALELLDKTTAEPEQALMIYTGLGDVLAFTGEYPIARERYQSALQIAADKIDKDSAEKQSAILRCISSTHERQGDYEAALTCLDSAQTTLDTCTTLCSEERAQILNDKGWICFRRGSITEAEENLTQALTIIEGSSSYDIIASIYNRLGGVYYKKTDIDQASVFLRKSLVLREEMGDTVAVARSYNNLGLLAWQKSNLQQALENFERSIELNASLGDAEALVLLHSNIGLIQTDRGEMENARLHLEESMSKSKALGLSFLEGVANLNLSRFWLSSRDWLQSLDYGDRALAIFDEIGASENLDNLYVMMGEAHLGLGELDPADEASRKARELIERNDPELNRPSLVLGRYRRLLGNLARARKDYETAVQQLKQAIEIFTSLDNPLEMGRALLSQAWVSQAKGDKVATRVQANEARLIFRQLGAKRDLQVIEATIVESL